MGDDHKGRVTSQRLHLTCSVGWRYIHIQLIDR